MIAPENPQAFPHGDPTHGGDIGMTLRDWFAGQTLAGLVSATDSTGVWTAPLGDDADITAERAYRVADAMLAERAKGDAA